MINFLLFFLISISTSLYSQSLYDTQIKCDGLALKVSKLANKAVKWRTNDNGESCSQKRLRNGKKLRSIRQSDDAHLELWTNFWKITEQCNDTNQRLVDGSNLTTGTFDQYLDYVNGSCKKNNNRAKRIHKKLKKKITQLRSCIAELPGNILCPAGLITSEDPNGDGNFDIPTSGAEGDGTPFDSDDFGQVVVTLPDGTPILDTGVVPNGDPYSDPYASGSVGGPGSYDLKQYVLDNGLTELCVDVTYTPINQDGLAGAPVTTQLCVKCDAPVGVISNDGDPDEDGVFNVPTSGSEDDGTPFDSADFGQIVITDANGNPILDTGVVPNGDPYTDGIYSSGTVGGPGTFDLKQYALDNSLTSICVDIVYTPINQDGLAGAPVSTQICVECDPPVLNLDGSDGNEDDAEYSGGQDGVFNSTFELFESDGTTPLSSSCVGTVSVTIDCGTMGVGTYVFPLGSVMDSSTLVTDDAAKPWASLDPYFTGSTTSGSNWSFDKQTWWANTRINNNDAPVEISISAIVDITSGCSTIGTTLADDVALACMQRSTWDNDSLWLNDGTLTGTVPYFYVGGPSEFINSTMSEMLLVSGGCTGDFTGNPNQVCNHTIVGGDSRVNFCEATLTDGSSVVGDAGTFLSPGPVFYSGSLNNVEPTAVWNNVASSALPNILRCSIGAASNNSTVSCWVDATLNPQTPPNHRNPVMTDPYPCDSVVVEEFFLCRNDDATKKVKVSVETVNELKF